jgi:hypothetical protein
MDFIEIIAAALTFILGAWGAGAVLLKKVSKVSLESGELLVAIGKAGEDGQLTGDEIRAIIKEAKDIPAAVRDLRAKTIASGTTTIASSKG